MEATALPLAVSLAHRGMLLPCLEEPFHYYVLTLTFMYWALQIPIPPINGIISGLQEELKLRRPGDLLRRGYLQKPAEDSEDKKMACFSCFVVIFSNPVCSWRGKNAVPFPQCTLLFQDSTFSSQYKAAARFLLRNGGNQVFLPFFFSVQDKMAVVRPLSVPIYIPEITIGGHDVDKLYYQYKQVN